jgi:hypothetical protein
MVCIQQGSKFMYKLIHRLITALIVLTMFFATMYLTNQLDLPLFVGFLLCIPTVYVPLVVFLKVPFICDQKGCNGSAQLLINEHFREKWYRHFLLSGHKCNKCNHFIKLPKTSRASNHDFD